MEISWKRINEDTRNIIEEFERLYTYDRDFSECEKLLTDIFKIYSSKYNIQLDETQNFDHIFHQLLEEIKNVIDEYTPTDLNDQAEARKIDKFFEKMSQDIFKTAEIRGRLREIDPSNLEIIQALEKGIEESEARKKQIEGVYKQYMAIEAEIFGNTTPNLEKLTNAELNNIEHFINMESKLREIKTLQIAMNSMTPGVDESDIKINQDKIDELFRQIETAKTRVKNSELVDETRLENISLTDIDAAINEVIALRAEMDGKATIDFKTLQDNLQKVYSKHSNIYAIAGIDFSKMDPSTEEGRKAIREAYIPFRDICNEIKLDVKVYEKEIEIFNEQIEAIREEEKISEMEIPTQESVSKEIPEDIQKKLDADHEYYKKMVHAQMYGDDDYETAYDFCLNTIFKRHFKHNSFILRNEDGAEILEDDGNGNMVPKKGTYQTIDFETMQKAMDTMRKMKDPTFLRVAEKIGKLETTEDLLKFLQLEEYKDKLERYTKLKAGDKLAITEYKGYEAWKSAKTPEEKEAAKTRLYEEQSKDILYLKTYHYAPNEYNYKKQHHATAGKIGETYLPLEQFSKEKSLGQNMSVAMHNLYAFTRWQNPLKAKNGVGAFLTMLANTGNLITLVPRMLTRATGNIISKTVYDNENPTPNPYAGRRDARRGARVDYYREQGDGAFKARFKGWTDELFFRKDEREEVETIIQERQLAEIDKSNKAAYTAGVLVEGNDELQKQQQAIKRNREIRAADIRLIAGTKEVQGDIIRDTVNADSKTLSQRAIQRAALEYAGIDSSYISNTGSRDHAKNAPRNLQFTKDKPQIEGAKKITKPVILPVERKWGRKKGAVVAADPIGNAIRSREIKNTLTRWYALEEMALLKGQSALFNWGISRIKDTKAVVEQVQVQDGVRIEDQGHWQKSQEFVEEVIGTREGNTVSNLNMGDLEYSSEAFFEHTANASRPSVSWIEAPTAGNTQAMALDFVIPSNLSQAEYQALSELGYKAGDRIVYSVADEATRNLCNATGRVYASSYIDGMFQFTDQTNILEAVGQYFPERVDGALNIILESEAYAGDAGVQFFTESFSTSHGITSVMEKMNAWGTGWGIEHINAEALEAARETVDIIGLVPHDDLVWIPNMVEQPVYKWIEQSTTITDGAKVALKKVLTGLNNGITLVGVGTSVQDLVREAKTKTETHREIHSDGER